MTIDDQTERRERVVQHVLQRIAAAPPREAEPFVDVARWAIPALAAAAVIIAASLATIRVDRAAGPATVTDALGVEPRLARYVERGEVNPWIWMTGAEVRP